LEVEAKIRQALQERELEQLRVAEHLAETLEGISAGLLDEIRHAHVICRCVSWGISSFA
jgi:hypothetical protein